MKRLLMLTLILGLAGLLFGQSWEIVKKGDMEYYPNAGVFFNADTGIYVGQDGAVIMTTDGGHSGDLVRVPNEGDPSWADVGFANRMVGFACGKDGVIFKTTDGGQTWVEVDDNTNFSFDLYKIAVVDENIVYVAGKSGVLKTTDGGSTWAQINYSFEVSGKAQKLDGGIAFCDANVGVVATSANKGATWYTHDGGATWTLVQLTFPAGTVSKRIYDVAAYGDSTFVLATYHYCIFLSEDGGKTYTQINGNYTTEFKYLKSIQMLDENTVVAGGSDGHVFMTTDKGANWSDISIPAAHTIQFVYFLDAHTGYVFGADGQWFRTSDGGTTYQPLLGWPNVDFKGLAVTPDDKVVATCYRGDMTISYDGGWNWTYPDNHFTGGGNTLYAVDFANENLGLAGGYHGDLYRTTDGGQTWTKVESPMSTDSKSIYAIRFMDENTVFAAGSKGYIMRSDDGGQTWTKIGCSESSSIYDLWVVSSKQMLAGASSGKLLVSTAALDSFYLKNDYGSMNLRGIEFKGDNGVVVAAKGYIFHTTIANWDTLDQVFKEPDGDDFLGVAFVNDTLVYAVGEHGKIYYSTDAGLTWAKDDSLTDLQLERAKFANNKLWVVGADGIVLKKDFQPEVATTGLYINEFMASNDAAFADENGEYDDWIEIYNANDYPVNIGGMYITDDLSDPTAYQIADSMPGKTTIPAGGFLVLWADKQPEQGVLHVGIKLSGKGEQIGLAEMFEGQPHFIDSLTFGPQTTDISYGRKDDGGNEWVYFSKASPGETNANGIVVGIDRYGNQTVTEYALSQNYPNPFNPTTNIEFSLKKAGHTTLTIYTITGQKVATLIDKNMKAGKFKVTVDASKLASGMYFYQIKSGKFSAVRKMLLMK